MEKNTDCRLKKKAVEENQSEVDVGKREQMSRKELCGRVKRKNSEKPKA